MDTINSIKKYNMSSRLNGVEELYKVLHAWRSSNPDTFRLDGHHSIGPANPAQWVFFEINDFTKKCFQGTEFGKDVDGTAWNGIYYLTASTRGISIDHFITLFQKYSNSSKIFELSYTQGKEGIPSKRKILLKDSNTDINAGWFCKQYYKKY